MLTAEFWDACEAHDWYYNFSDDHGVWRRGEDERKRLIALAESNPDFLDIFMRWQAHKLAPLMTNNACHPPKPKRPKVETFDGPVPTVNPNQMELST
jgi:hypothetical protein